MAEKSKYENFVIGDGSYNTILTEKHKNRKPYSPPKAGVITAFIPGTIREIFVKEGDAVNEGQTLLILEAMKMRNKLIAPFSGMVKEIKVKENEVVSKSYILVVVE